MHGMVRHAGEFEESSNQVCCERPGWDFLKEDGNEDEVGKDERLRDKNISNNAIAPLHDKNRIEVHDLKPEIYENRVSNILDSIAPFLQERY